MRHLFGLDLQLLELDLFGNMANTDRFPFGASLFRAMVLPASSDPGSLPRLSSGKRPIDKIDCLRQVLIDQSD